ncbi:unnamed protein product [Paramecium octaurelia]|uniref:Uncharacterized protein n=1 Tax=Paramecium octaurelia TaxID=43137 RepID=A0A8S1U5X7_PAROT|nr:unnamed protein product [Paramecium octaurelia]CAD8159414.1 unnamed protein product [Paramecium octaurelia]
MEYNEIKQQIVSNIKENKQKIKDLQVFLKTQHYEYSEAQEKLEEEKQRRRKAKSSKNKFSSFENAINRPPFFSATHVQQTFHEQPFIDNEVPALTATQKEQLIMPQRNKSPSSITYKIDHPLSKLQSDFPSLKPNQMSEKEIKRLEYWQTITNQTTKLQIEEQNKQLIGSLKKKELEQKHTQVFQLANTNLRLLDPKPSLISENPLTPRRLQKLITLPRLYEKKVWTPNNNYF